MFILFMHQVDNLVRQIFYIIMLSRVTEITSYDHIIDLFWDLALAGVLYIWLLLMLSRISEI